MKNVVLFFLISLSTICKAEKRPIPPILKKLNSTSKSIQVFHSGLTQWIDILDLPHAFKSTPQHIVKTSEGIFLLIPGTGRVYKAEFENELIDFRRIDSTVFFGYNFHSLSFSVGATIYSYGGTGFWRNNGNLRIYQPDINEWNALLTNILLPKNFFAEGPLQNVYFIDTASNSFYLNGSNGFNEHIKNRILDTISIKKLYKMDLKSGDWIEKGFLNFRLFHIPLASISIGQFNEMNVIDFVGNKIYSHDKRIEVTSILGQSKYYYKSVISFCIDSTIYFGNESDRIDSISFTRADFKDTGMPAYLINDKNDSWKYVFVFGLILFLVGTFFIYIRFKKKNINNNLIQNVNQTKNIDTMLLSQNKLRSGSYIDLLNSQQLEFLRFIYDHSSDERTTTIDEINRILGTQQKTVEIQKKMRSDMINGINDRISLSLKIKSPIIDKQRSEFDKRSFEYFINPVHMNLVKDILETA